MKELLHILDQVPEFQQLLDALDAGRSPAAVSGLSRSTGPISPRVSGGTGTARW